MHTEAEAREKWCPFVRHVMTGIVEDIRGLPAENRNTDAHNPEWCRCIASECMAWRWDEEQPPKLRTPDGRQGYCGLAGKP